MEKFILIQFVETDSEISVEGVFNSLSEAQIAMKNAYNEYHSDILCLEEEDIDEAAENEDCGIDETCAWSCIDEFEERRWKIEKITV